MTTRGPAIVLIGFMGSGKTSVARLLSERLALPCFDTDVMVSEKAELLIAEIFAQRGEEEFRSCEAEMLARIPQQAAVIATGGGIVLRAANVSRLRELGWLIYLSATEQVLLDRVSRGPARPLLQTDDPRGTLAELLRVREPLYRAAADSSVDTSHLRAEEVAEAVLALVQLRE